MDQVKQLGSGFSPNPAGTTPHLHRLLERPRHADLETGRDHGPTGAVLGMRV